MKRQPQEHPARTAPDITISNRQRVRKLDLRRLKKIASATLAELKIETAELGIVLLGAKEMASINEEFLGHEGPTDVITFDYKSPQSTVHSPQSAKPKNRRTILPLPAGEGRGEGESSERKHSAIHGEIFVCIPEAERQAKLFKTNWQAEVDRYIIHGILHLIGYDDLQPIARKKMKREEERLVRKVSAQH